MPSQIVLECWSDEVCDGHLYLTLNLKNFEYSFIDQKIQPKDPIQGWFAFYEGRLFCVFSEVRELGYKIFKIGCLPGNIYSLSGGIQTEWESTAWGRYFKLVSNEGNILFLFSYRSPKQYIFHPLKYLTDVILSSDWWELESDLPCFVHSELKKAGGLESALLMWNERRLKNEKIGDGAQLN